MCGCKLWNGPDDEMMMMCNYSMLVFKKVTPKSGRYALVMYWYGCFIGNLLIHKYVLGENKPRGFSLIHVDRSSVTLEIIHQWVTL